MKKPFNMKRLLWVDKPMIFPSFIRNQTKNYIDRYSLLRDGDCDVEKKSV